MRQTEPDAAYWIKHLELKPHPEGGYFREVYRSSEMIGHKALPQRFAGPRCFCTSIFYLLEAGDFSSFHQIRSDETWHFYGGGTLDLFVLNKGQVEHHQIGSRVDRGEKLQWTVPAEAWFAARPAAGAAYVLTGCTVSPGFDFADFSLAKTENLIALYPQHSELIARLTRKSPQRAN